MDSQNTLSNEWRDAVKAIKNAILQSQYHIAQLANKELLSLYYSIGRYVSSKTRTGTWGTGAVNAICDQLHKELPGLRGFSPSAIKRMRTFYEQWQMLENRPLTMGEGSTLANIIDSQILANRPLAVGDLEIKMGSFKPSYLGQLSAYLRILDDEVKKPFENPSVGIVLCKDANKSFVEFLIQGYENPMGVATYKTAEDVRKVLPSEEELRRVMDEEI